jgi:hypothetical protein
MMVVSLLLVLYAFGSCPVVSVPHRVNTSSPPLWLLAAASATSTMSKKRVSYYYDRMLLVVRFIVEYSLGPPCEIECYCVGVWSGLERHH